MIFIHNLQAIHGILPPKAGAMRGEQMHQGMSAIETPGAWLLIDGDKIAAFGSSASAPILPDDTQRIDAKGGRLLPAFADSHTHIVWSGSRHGEYIDKIHGLTYEEIASRGGGILNSAALLQQTSETDLYHQSLSRLEEVVAKGTGAIEIKSGYGLTLESELKILRVIARLAQHSPARIRATFLGAHAVGPQYRGRQQEYVDHIISQMLPAVAAEGLADFVDVFCDKGFFTTTQTDAILTAAAHYGLRPKIHAAELATSDGSVKMAVTHNALSVDHLERMTPPDIEALKHSGTIATMLPGASFFLGMPYAPARQAIAHDLAVALASDYNPGSSPSGDMRTVMALGCIKMRLTPQESLCATTINGAAAMDLHPLCGSITAGKDASLIITKPIPDLASITYNYTSPWIQQVIIRGKFV